MTTTPAMPEPLGWYVINNIGMATLCKDEAEAQLLAEDCDMVYQRQAPHRAVQLVALAALQSAQPAAAVSDEAIYAVWAQHCQTPGTTTRQLVCGFARAILVLRPQAVPMTGKQARLLSREELAGCCGGCASNSAIETWMRRAIEKFCEVNGITAPAGGEG